MFSTCCVIRLFTHRESTRLESHLLDHVVKAVTHSLVSINIGCRVEAKQNTQAWNISLLTSLLWIHARHTPSAAFYHEQLIFEPRFRDFSLVIYVPLCEYFHFGSDSSFKKKTSLIKEEKITQWEPQTFIIDDTSLFCWNLSSSNVLMAKSNARWLDESYPRQISD